jgi:hypothetical protein
MAESFRNKPRIFWTDAEKHQFFLKMFQLEADGLTNRTELMERANETMEKRRPIHSSVVSTYWGKYLEWKKLHTQQLRKANANVAPSTIAPPVTAANDAPATNGAPSAVAAPPLPQSAPPHVAPSVSNPFPNAPLPGAAKPRADYLQGVTSDGPPPPTVYDEVVGWLKMGIEDVLVGLMDSPQIGPRIEQGLARWRDIIIGNIEAREAARDRTVFDEKKRGPRIIVAGYKPDINARLEQIFAGRANLSFFEQHKATTELKKMLQGNYEKIDAVICARFMGHPAHNMAKAMMREKYFWNDGGLTTVVEKIERICVNWTSAQLAAHPRSGSMSAGSATGTH